MPEKIASVIDFGQMIKKRRKALNLTQQELAGLTDVSAYFISFLENGKETAEIGKAFAVMEALGLTMTVSEQSWHAHSKAFSK